MNKSSHVMKKLCSKFLAQKLLTMSYHFQEAYVKALGKGFSGAPFKTFTIRFRGVTEGDFSAFEDSSTKVSHEISCACSFTECYL